VNNWYHYEPRLSSPSDQTSWYHYRQKCSLPPFQRTNCLSVHEAKQQAGWAVTAFDLPNAWKTTQGEGVLIAILDSGCELDHPDLVNNLVAGRNFVTPNQDPIDGNCHGTHVTGILVAENNDIGMVGVCPKAKVMPIKTLDDAGNGNMLNVAEAIKWAITQKVDFISMSLGCPFKIQQVRKAIQQAAAAGIVTFCAAGNAGQTHELYYPANYPETISIGAINKDMQRASFSSTGNNLDFLAPGVDILSTVPPHWYAILSGTSMAQPFACGVAALLLSYVRNHATGIQLRTANDYRQIFRQHTTPINGNNKFYEGFGIIDPRKLSKAMGW
jgi:subtilisin family serine protease